MDVLARLALVPLVAAVTVGGVWVAGGQLTDDFRAAMVLTAVWFGAAGLAALGVGIRWRGLRIPVLGTFVVVAAAIGIYLAVSTFRDTVVMEQAAAGTELTAGSFVSVSHGTTGRAELVEGEGGAVALNLVDLETDPGPDLRVYLVPSDGTDVSGALDLGALKGNVGSQTYELPSEANPAAYGAVVIWCRAFSVAFGRAALDPSGS